MLRAKKMLSVPAHVIRPRVVFWVMRMVQEGRVSKYTLPAGKGLCIEADDLDGTAVANAGGEMVYLAAAAKEKSCSWLCLRAGASDGAETYAVENVLQLSIAHLPKAEVRLLAAGANEWLGDPGVPPAPVLRVPTDTFGLWWVYCGTDDVVPMEELTRLTLTGYTQLQGLMHVALENGCRWLVFDEFGSLKEDLPTWRRDD